MPVKFDWKIFTALIISFVGYFLFGYVLHREQFLQLVSVYLILFAAYIFLLKRSDDRNFAWLIVAAIFFRITFLFSIPALSDDYFRFVWDGNLITKGVNPYLQIPSVFIQQNGNEYLQRLLDGMNSPNYFSVYPPIGQFLFAVVAFLSPNNLYGSVIILHFFCVAAEAGSIFILIKLLSQFQLPKKNVLWFALNPLVIIELSGNVHLEAILIFFLLLAVYLLVLKKNLLSSIAFAFAVCIKIVPLMFLPFLIKRLKARSIIYFLITAIVCALLFFPFINNQLISNIGSSVDLYFQKFEFNASMYFLIRWIGFQITGYNIIQSAGPWLALSVFVIVMILGWKEKKIELQNFFRMMQFSLTIFFLLSTTVHPWYITTLVMMSVITGYRYAIVWSLMIVLSYATYQTKSYNENLWLTAVEYVAVISVLIIEIKKSLKNSIDLAVN
ncbi:MAG: glycosyltransferase 87 family protein [Chitinophagales bacterium]|nr:glycosyltransferase 87 family protein [Chitinophagales bacterium]